jgi:UDP-glucose 4-epimerase
LAVEKLEPGSTIEVNLGTGQGHSVLEIIQACREVTGHPIPVVEGDRRPGDPARLIADASKAQRVLGWKPRYTDLKELIATAWNWHRHHPRGYRTR